MANNDRKVVYSTELDAESPFSVLRESFASEPLAEDAPERQTAAKPAPPPTGHPVKVQRERKGRRGKTVSVVMGTPGPSKRRAELLKQLKQKLGAGGSLEGDNIVIQGDHRERIVDLLNEMGYRAKSAGG